MVSESVKGGTAGTPNKLLTPETYYDRVTKFLESRPKGAKTLTAGSVELIDLSTLAGRTGALTAEQRIAARLITMAVIERSIGLQDLFVQCGEDAFVILFHKSAPIDATAISERISGEISRLLHAEPKTQTMMAQGYAAEVEEALTYNAIGTPKDLIATCQRAYEAFRDKQHQRVQPENSGVSLVFYPVLNIKRRHIAAYEVRLLEAREGGPPADLSYDTSSPALSAEVDVRLIQGLAEAWKQNQNARARPFVLLPVRIATLANSLYRSNVVEALGRLPDWAHRRTIFHVCCASGQRPPLQTPQIVEALDPYSRLRALRVPPDPSNLLAAAELNLALVSPQPPASTEPVAEIAALTAFSRTAREAGLRPLFAGATSVDDAARARDCGFAYVSGPGVSRPFPRPGPRYALGKQL